jgi:hypothetical protein
VSALPPDDGNDDAGEPVEDAAITDQSVAE